MDVFEALAQWRERLTGTRESAAGSTLDEGVETLLRWQARKLVAEQMIVLEMASLMLRHKLSIGDLAKYLGSTEVKKQPLGRLAFVSGLQTWVRRVGDCFLPLLRQGAYRPFLQTDVARAMLALQKVPGLPPNVFDLGNAADAFYRDGTSPFVAVRSLKSLRALAKQHPESLPQMLQAIGLARREAAGDIANLQEADCVAEAFAPAPTDPPG